MTLVAFDFDETLSQSDPSILLGREYDVATEMRGFLEQGVRDEIDFETSLQERVSLLEGMPERRVEAAFERCSLRDGVADMITALRRSDIRVAVLTGSFERAVEAALEQAEMTVDHVVANRLVIENGAVTGDVDGSVLDGQKDGPLGELAVADGVDLEQTIAVGNGATDLSMLRAAWTAVGFNPEPVVEQYCDVAVTSVRKLHLYFEQHGIIDTGER